MPLLARPEIHDSFGSFCFRVEERQIAVGRYILIPDHVHLFVALPVQDLTLEKWVQALRSVIGKQLLRLGFQKPQWQESFFNQLLRSQESYSQKWDYVQMNAVRAGLCETPESWTYQGEIISPVLINRMSTATERRSYNSASLSCSRLALSRRLIRARRLSAMATKV